MKLTRAICTAVILIFLFIILARAEYSGEAEKNLKNIAITTVTASGIADDRVKTEKKWKDTAQITFLSTNGNSKATTLGTSNLFKYGWTRVTLELTASAFGSTSEEKVSEERYAASEKISWKMGVKNYIFEKFNWDKNRFAGIQNRYDLSSGLGHELLNKPKDDIIVEIGGGYVNEERTKAAREDFASGKAYGKYTHVLSDTASFSQDAEYLHNFKEPNNYRLNTNSMLTAALSTYLSLKISYTWKFVNVPPEGFIKSDTTTSVALILNY